uniref:Peptidase S1 domain-containing protein n=1 Tax=Steinernema glaseri TaxID=37863 RepID=A0A1I7Y493_9BILA
MEYHKEHGRQKQRRLVDSSRSDAFRRTKRNITPTSSPDMKTLVLLPLVLILSELSLASECGRSYEFWELHRSIYGEAAPKAPAFPWYAALRTTQFDHHRNSTSGRGRIFCAGSVVGRRWILTAASCVVRSDDVKVLLGFKYTKRVDPLKRVYDVKRTIIHKDFDVDNWANDIALIEWEMKYLGYIHEHPSKNHKFDGIRFKTTQPILFNRHVQPVCLPKSDEILSPGTSANTTSLGVDRLHQVESPLVGTDSGSVRTETRAGFCGVDPGAPLTRKQLFDISWLYGVSSGGPRCGQPEGKFTRVTHFCDWIARSTDREVLCQEGNE